jgi:hypothetical protein
MKQLIFFVALFFSTGVLAQEVKFTATVSRSTVALNSKFKVEFKLENAQGGNFKAPDFEDFELVGGPSTNSSMSIVNGDVTQSISYVFYLKPKEVGAFRVKPASVKVNGKEVKTEELDITVVEEIDGGGEEEEQIQQMDPFGSMFPFRFQQPQPAKELPKKKRKSYSI